jgi:hypothetical protein
VFIAKASLEAERPLCLNCLLRADLINCAPI